MMGGTQVHTRHIHSAEAVGLEPGPMRLPPSPPTPDVQPNSPLPRGHAWLAPEPEDALDVAGEAALGLGLQLVLQRGESHMVEGQVEEQGLAGDGLEARREVHKVGLLGDKGRVQAKRLKPFNQRLAVLHLG